MTMKKTYKRVPRNVLSEDEDKYCQACVLSGGNGSEAVAKAWPHTTKWPAQARAEKSAKLQRKGKIFDDIETKRGRGKRTKIKLTDRISAMKLIGQQHGMFKRETTVNRDTPIPVVLSQAEQQL
jgi:hypothetical protein